MTIWVPTSAAKGKQKPAPRFVGNLIAFFLNLVKNLKKTLLYLVNSNILGSLKIMLNDNFKHLCMGACMFVCVDILDLNRASLV